MKRILIIEDDPAVRQLVVDTIKLKSWSPLEAEDGAKGLALAIREIPDLILCDVQMPHKDGFEVLRRIRENAATATTPFIFLTGNGEKPRVRQAMELGADDFLVKPFTVKELVAAVEAGFARHERIEQSSDHKLSALTENLSFALPHEFVTPLNSILGFSALLLEAATPEQVREFAGFIRSAGERLHRLVEKFLLYSQLELAVANANRRASGPAGIPSETADIAIAAAQRAVVGCKRDADLRLNVISCVHGINAMHFARVVQELVENACLFSSAGAPVQLTTRLEEENLVIEVSDQGTGLNTDQIRKIGAHLQFDRRVNEQQGTGLGLAIVRRVADLYGGELLLRSAPGQGTTVSVRLPKSIPS